MLEIIVCEDDDVQNKSITDCLRNFVMVEDIDAKVALSTQKPQEVLDYVKEKKNVGLYFLDVELNSGMDGITLAEQIRNYDSRGFIVFVTSFPEKMSLTFKYKVEAMDYIIKDINLPRERICECVRNAYAKYTNKLAPGYEVFEIKQPGNSLKYIEYSKILCLTTSSAKHKIDLYAINNNFEFYGTLNDIEKALPKDFLRCHHSYIVNTKMIESFDKKNMILHLPQGCDCFVSSKYEKKFIQHIPVIERMVGLPALNFARGAV